MLIFLEGSWESLPFEIRLSCPWYGGEFCGGGSLTATQRFEIATQGYSIAQPSACSISDRRRQA
jgi:hypothetical protein